MRGPERYEPVTNPQLDTEAEDTDYKKSVYENVNYPSGASSSLFTEVNHSQRGQIQHPSKFKEGFSVKGSARHGSNTSFASTSIRSGRSSLIRDSGLQFLRDWSLELIGCFFIVGAIIALWATAYSYQDHPLPAWPHWITINSLLAIYIVVLKAAILLILAQGLSHLKWTWFAKPRPLTDLAKYDNASRGPLGSIGLLWTLRGRDIVSSIGAVIIVAAVILDPMAQQVVRYSNCPQSLDAFNATISRTNAYMEIGQHLAAGISTIPIGFQSAVNAGVLVPGATTVTYDCISGNCTFTKPFFTVGFASECTDVSNELEIRNVTQWSNYTIFEGGSGNGSNGTPRLVSQIVPVLNATLPSGLSTTYSFAASQLTTYMVMAYNLSTSSFEIIRGPRSVTPLPLEPDSCTTASASTLGNNRNASTWDCRDYGAARCRIKPAVFSVVSNIASGKLHEKLTLQTMTFSLADSAISVADVSNLTSEQKSALTSIGYVLPEEHEPQWLPYNISMAWNYTTKSVMYTGGRQNLTATSRSIIPPQRIYQVSSTTLMSLEQFFLPYLSGTIYPSFSQWQGSSSVAQQFYNSSSVTFESVNSMFQNISEAVTTHVRLNGWSNNSDPAVGAVWHTETCIHIRWPLFTFPAVLAILTLGFFVAMIIETRRAQQGVHHDFKSSPLALLFHGLDDQVQKKLERSHVGESSEIHHLNQEAKSMYVRLRPTEKGWRFVTEEHHSGQHIDVI